MRINLTKKEIINSIYMQLGYSKKILENILEDLLDIIIDQLIKNKKVKISNFGTFEIRHKKKRIGRNPKTKEEKIISERNVVLFKPSKDFKNFIQRGKYFKNKVMPVRNYQLSTQAKYLRLFKEMLDPNKGFGQDYKFCNLNYEDLLFKFGNNSRNAQISKIKMLNSVRSSCLKGISLNRLVGKISGPKISHPTVKKASLNALRKSQLKQIMDCRDIPQVTKNIIKLYILTGCRRSELCGPYFTWKHIDQDQNIAYIYRKNHKDKHSKPFSIPWLKEHMDLVNEISDYFKEYLDCPNAGKYPIPVSSQTLYNYIVKARKAVGFHFTLHDLRDTGATQVLRATGNIYAAKEFCGHRSVKDTEAHYADWIDDDKIKTTKTLVNTLNEVF